MGRAPLNSWTREFTQSEKKIVEEASEVWMAAEHESSDALAEEISQLIYHLQVLMVAKDISPEDVYRTL